jgi:hypothetical protein
MLNFILFVELLVVSLVWACPDMVVEPTVISDALDVLFPSLTETAISNSICWIGTPVSEQ